MNHFLGKLCIGTLFLVSGLMLAMDENKREAAKTLLAAHNIPFPYVLLIIAIALKIIGGLMLMVSFNQQVIRTNAFLLICFTVIATWLYHNPMENKNEIINALKNLAIIGGLLLLL